MRLSREIPGWQWVRGSHWPGHQWAPLLVSQDSGSLTPHLPGPRKTPPAFGNWSFPPRTANPQSRVLPWPDLEEVVCPAAHGEPGLAAPSGCLVPEWLLSEPEMDSSQSGQRGPDSFLPRAEPMHRASGGGPSPRGLAVYMEEASRPLGQPPHCPLGPLTQSPAQLPGLQGRAESGRRVNDLSVSCPLNSRGFRCHRGGGVSPRRSQPPSGCAGHAPRPRRVLILPLSYRVSIT